ncbi:hypothetical protein B0H10DRAFT_549681 [Mycena sp. CBHHK59/15]|nr:hypothetical protein B0H10DRAFT_549681 [Mycena sp. CBHHK59/15]
MTQWSLTVPLSEDANCSAPSGHMPQGRFPFKVRNTTARPPPISFPAVVIRGFIEMTSWFQRDQWTKLTHRKHKEKMSSLRAPLQWCSKAKPLRCYQSVNK